MQSEGLALVTKPSHEQAILWLDMESGRSHGVAKMYCHGYTAALMFTLSYTFAQRAQMRTVLVEKLVGCAANGSA